MSGVADLRWRWMTEERTATPGVGHREYVAAFVAFAAATASTHRCVVAERDGALVGMAWMAVVPRVPVPHALERASGDVQSVYVVPEERGGGTGSALVGSLLEAADREGLEHVTVHSSASAVAVYRRLGFVESPTYLVRRRRAVDRVTGPAGSS
jgi:GNAT superfamily N-acetyltransferase